MRKPSTPMSDHKAQQIRNLLWAIEGHAEDLNSANTEDRTHAQRGLASACADIIAKLHSEPGATTHMPALEQLLGPACWVSVKL
jgi:hypothetical protein